MPLLSARLRQRITPQQHPRKRIPSKQPPMAVVAAQVKTCIDSGAICTFKGHGQRVSARLRPRAPAARGEGHGGRGAMPQNTQPETHTM